MDKNKVLQLINELDEQLEDLHSNDWLLDYQYEQARNTLVDIVLEVQK